MKAHKYIRNKFSEVSISSELKHEIPIHIKNNAKGIVTELKYILTFEKTNIIANTMPVAYISGKRIVYGKKEAPPTQIIGIATVRKIIHSCCSVVFLSE